VIRSFRDREAEKLFHNRPSKFYKLIERTVRRKLTYLDAAETLADLALPGHHLERLKGDARGSTAFGLTINIGSVFDGKRHMHSKWKLLTITNNMFFTGGGGQYFLRVLWPNS
jgi:plasmid maintenance system killer protein